MSTLNLLPAELRRHIYDLSIPSTTTIKVGEDEYDVTYISPPPGLLTASHEARNAALKWELKKFPIWTVDDWQDIYLSSEDTILELVIAPSKSASLNITWTELQAILGDALTEAKHLHILCAKPERLVRLFMLPEAELVSVGQSCVEKGLFGDEVISSDRTVRESLRSEVLVTTSTSTIEEISSGMGGAVEEWRLVDEEVSDGFGPEAKIFSTKAFESRTKAPKEDVEEEMEEEEEVVVENSGEMLTEEALERLVEEMERLHPSSAYKSGKEDPGGSIMPELD